MSPTQGPNMLLIMTDQQKADSLAAYGNRYTETPAVDALAERGVVVDGAICNYPACTPARSAVMTGRYPHTTGVRANHLHLPAHELHLPLVLARAGYTLGLVGKNHVLPDGSLVSQFREGTLALREFPNIARDAVLEDALARDGVLADHRPMFAEWFAANHFGPLGAEFEALRSFALRPELWRSAAGTGTIPLPAEQCTAAVLGRRAAGFVRNHSGASPWFCWLSFPDPHNPYIAPEPYASMYDPDDVDVPPDDPMTDKPTRHHITKRMNGMHVRDEATIRRAVAVQYGQVTAIDDAIGVVLDALAETDQASNTIVVFMTDHGGYVGDHGAWHKSLAFFECLVRIPLVISWPGTIPAARLTDGFIEEVDLMPTILDLVDVEQPPGIQGRSMANALMGAAGVTRELAISEGGEAGEPVGWDDLPFLPDDALDHRYFGWDGFQEAWIGQGKMVRTQDWKYVWWANGDEELYDLRADPDELRNVASLDDPDTASRKAHFRDELLRFAVRTEDQLAPHTFNVYMADVAEGRLPF